MNDVEGQTQEQALAQHIKEALKDHPAAEVRVNPTIQAPIPATIANNLLVFLQRAQATGIECMAWAEAFQYVQQYASQPQQAPQGVPFGGLPSKG
jgi:hypothetical protein